MTLQDSRPADAPAPTAAPAPAPARTGTAHAGWYLLAFDDELTADLTPVALGDRALMLVREEDGDLGLYDATCPHRGSNLAHGGRLDRGAVVCPFHGKRVQLGACDRPWSVARHQLARVGPLVLGRIGTGEAGDCAALATLGDLLAGMEIRGAVRTPVRAPAELVVENAFDADHFSVVHGVPAVVDATAAPHPDGYLVVEAQFRTVSDPWTSTRIRQGLQAVLGPGANRYAADSSAFRAAALSPTLVATRFGSGATRTVIVTGAVPTPQGCVARVAVAAVPGGAPLDRVADGARKALDQDVVVWDHIDHAAPHRYDEQGDAAVLAFQAYCAGFPR